MNWQIIHRYNFLAENGLAKPLACLACEGRVVMTLDALDEPAMSCYACGAVVSLGQNTYENMKAIVKEFYP